MTAAVAQQHGVAALIGYPSFDDYIAEFLEQQPHPDAEAARALIAMQLAPTLNVYQALLRDEPVPTAALDQKWAARYGLLR